MAKKPHSVEFCGVKLVRWGYRPRNCVKVVIGQYTLALLKNGAVACSSDKPFEVRSRAFMRDPDSYVFLSKYLADDLFALGAITAKVRDEHKQRISERLEKRKARDAATAVRDGAKLFGISLTPAQNEILKHAEPAF
jgi:hypothetical protein